MQTLQSKSEEICAKAQSEILKALDSELVPWHQPWQSDGPVNALSGKNYRGGNYFYLMIKGMVKGYTDNRWLTYNQAKEVGRTVRKGETGTIVVRWNFPDTVISEDGVPQKKGFVWARYFTVFNVEQTDVDDLNKTKKTLSEYGRKEIVNPIESANAIHEYYAKHDGPIVKHGSQEACYIPLLDEIRMPNIGDFKNVEEYHGTRFHEEVHSTGNEKRLDREVANSFGNEKYSLEELVAELGSAMLRAHAGIKPNYPANAAYIAHWRKKLGDDPTMFTKAASRAQKAVDRIIGSGITEEIEEAE